MMEGGGAPKCDDDNPTVTIVHKYVAYQNYHRRSTTWHSSSLEITMQCKEDKNTEHFVLCPANAEYEYLSNNWQLAEK